MTLVNLIAIILATYRLSSLVVEEGGPFNVFQNWREIIGIDHYEDGSICNIPNNFPARLFGCLWCMSLWIAGLVYLIWRLEPIPVYILAASAGVMVIDNVRK